MKILIVSPFENTSTGRGDRYTRLENALIEKNHSVTFVTSNFDHGKKTHISSEKLFSRIGLKVIRVPGYYKNVGLKRILCHWVFAIKLWF